MRAAGEIFPSENSWILYRSSMASHHRRYRHFFGHFHTNLADLLDLAIAIDDQKKGPSGRGVFIRNSVSLHKIWHVDLIVDCFSFCLSGLLRFIIRYLDDDKIKAVHDPTVYYLKSGYWQ